MDIGSLVWFRRPAADKSTPSRRRSLATPLGTHSHESSWRDWEIGKIVNLVQKPPSSTTFTVALQFDDGEVSDENFDVTIKKSNTDEAETNAAKDNATISEIELRNVTGQSSVETTAEVDDLTVLTHLHEPEILHALRLRYELDVIYTATGPILLAMNPFKSIPDLYDTNRMSIYAEAGLQTARGLMESSTKGPPPHAFAIADSAFRDMCASDTRVESKAGDNASPQKRKGGGIVTENQTILVSGESGAGKTETTKFIMAYLAKLAELEGGGSPEVQSEENLGPQEKVLRSNPVLESFGNARTVRNDNSSRFGKFIELQFDVTKLKQNRFAVSAADVPLVGASVRTYLLEKVRVVKQSLDERNFHIFYLLGAGTDASQRFEFRLGDENDDFSWREHHYLNQSECWERRDGVDDEDEYEMLVASMNAMDFRDEEQESALRVAAAVLQLGDIGFEASEEGHAVASSSVANQEPVGDKNRRRTSSAEVADDAKEPLSNAAILLRVSEDALQRSLTLRQIHTPEGQVTLKLKPETATHARDAMAKMVYGELFEWVVARINSSIEATRTPFDRSQAVTTPSNGKSTSSKAKGSSRSTASGRTAKRELAFIGVLDIFGFESFTVNSFEQLCINYCNETLQQQFNGFVLQREQNEYKSEQINYEFVNFRDSTACLQLIESKRTGILAALQEQCLAPKGTDKQFAATLYRNCKNHPCFDANDHVKAVDGFVVIHYAGPVCYSSEGFKEKNMDFLSPEALELLQSSTDPFVKRLQEQQSEREAASAAAAAATGSGNKSTPRRGSVQTGGGSGGSLKQLGLGNKFKMSLEELNSLIATTGPHYVRCLKPNSVNSCDNFNAMLLAGQLKCNGVLEAIKVTRSGFSNRFPHRNFLKTFQALANGGGAVTHKPLPKAPKDACAVLLARTLGENAERFSFPATNDELQSLGVQVGRTKVFLRQGAYEKIEHLRNSAMRSAATTIAAVARRRQASRRYHSQRNAAATLQMALRCLAARRRVTIVRRRLNATICLQCFWRARKALWSVLKIRRVRAATKLAAWHRAREPRQRLKQAQVAAVFIQCLKRRAVAKMVFAQRRRQAKDLGNVQQQAEDLKASLSEAKRKIKQLNATLRERTAERDAALQEVAEFKEQQGEVQPPPKASTSSTTDEEWRKRIKVLEETIAAQSEQLKTMKEATSVAEVGKGTEGRRNSSVLSKLFPEIESPPESPNVESAVGAGPHMSRPLPPSSSENNFEKQIEKWRTEVRNAKNEAREKSNALEAAKGDITKLHGMLEEWKNLKSKIADFGGDSGPESAGAQPSTQLSAGEAQLAAAMATKAQALAESSAEKLRRQLDHSTAEVERLREAFQSAERLAAQEAKLKKELDRKLSTLREEKTAIEAERAVSEAATSNLLSPSSPSTSSLGLDEKRRVEMEEEILQLRKRLEDMTTAAKASSSEGRQRRLRSGPSSAGGSSEEALEVLASGQRDDLQRLRLQMDELRNSERAAVRAREATAEANAKLQSQWQQASRKAAALASERDTAIAHAQKIEEMFAQWQSKDIGTQLSAAEGARSAAAQAAQVATEDSLAQLQRRLSALMELNESLTSELSVVRSDLAETTHRCNSESSTALAANVSLEAAKIDAQTVKKRLAMLQEDLSAAEVDRSSLRERLKEAHASMREQAIQYQHLVEESKTALAEVRIESGMKNMDASVVSAMKEAEKKLMTQLEQRAGEMRQRQEAAAEQIGGQEVEMLERELAAARKKVDVSDEALKDANEAAAAAAAAAAKAAADTAAHYELEREEMTAKDDALRKKMDALQLRLSMQEWGKENEDIEGVDADWEATATQCVAHLESTFPDEVEIIDNESDEAAEDGGNVGISDGEEKTALPFPSMKAILPGISRSSRKRDKKNNNSSAQRDTPILEKHRKLCSRIRRVVDGRLGELEQEVNELQQRLVSQHDEVGRLEGTVQRVRAHSRAMSMDATAAAAAEAAAAEYNDAMQLVRENGDQDPIMQLICRPRIDQDVMKELLHLENEGYDLNEKTTTGERPIHLLCQHAGRHPARSALAILRLFLAFADANEVRADGATALHICLATNAKHAWFLSQPLVAAGADLNLIWHCPPPNWTEMIDDATGRSFWYNEVTGNSSWGAPEGGRKLIPSKLASELSLQPPLGIVQSISGPAMIGPLSTPSHNSVVLAGGDNVMGGRNGSGLGSGIDDENEPAVDALLDDCLASICAPQSWVIDDSITACMACDKPFGIMSWRHHCRHCGRLICKACQREMRGVTVWASPDSIGDQGDAGRSSVSRRSSATRTRMSTISGIPAPGEPVKICAPCGAAHYRGMTRGSTSGGGGGGGVVFGGRSRAF